MNELERFERLQKQASELERKRNQLEGELIQIKNQKDQLLEKCNLLNIDPENLENIIAEKRKELDSFLTILEKMLEEIKV